MIRFVGRTRAALGDKGGQIDPGTAERLLGAVLSDPAQAAGLDRDKAALATMALLKALVTEEGLTGALVEPTRSVSRSSVFASGAVSTAPTAIWPPPCLAAPRVQRTLF